MSPSPIAYSVRLILLLLGCLLPLASAKGAGGPPSPSSAFPAPLLHAGELTYTVVLYHPTPPPGDVVAEARKLLAAKYKELTAAGSQVEVRSVPTEDLELAPEDLMAFFARRLDAGERRRLLGARHATKLVFHVPFARRHEGLLASTRLVHQLATERGAFLWDDETREYFPPQRWKEERLEGWSGGTPSVASHMTAHVYGEGEGVRFVTLGMVKLGLPDLVVEQVPRSMTVPMGTVLNGIAQLLVEGLTLSEDGTLAVDLRRVKDARLRRQIEAHTTADAVRTLTVRALEARRDDGDPINPLLELSFPGSGTPHERQIAALDALLGKSPDALTRVPPGDPELAAVSRKARARLQQLRPRVERGLSPPEALVVKAGFRSDDGGSEHMWFQVSGWEKDRLRGTLANEPFDVSGLRLGSSVSVPLEDVDDYRYTRPDGTEEGGESSRILQRRQEGR